MDLGQQPEQGLGNPPQPAVIHAELEIGRDFLQAILVLGTRIELRPGFALLARVQDQGGTGEAGDIETAFGDPRAVGVTLVGVGYPGAEEVVLDHGNPAAGQVCLERIFLHVLEGKLGKVIIRLGGGRAQERRQPHAT